MSTGGGESQRHIDKLETYIPGFDLVALGGLPRGRTTLISGTAGSAKTVFACQFLAEAILQKQESGVFVTFEESTSDIRKNVIGFGWDIQRWERENKWAFVDASPQPGAEPIIIGEYDLGGFVGPD